MTDTTSLPGPLVVLHFAFPAAIEEDIIDFCHEQGRYLPGFTMFAAEGFGASGRLNTAVETVMGRARSRVLFAIVAAQDAPAIVSALRSAIPSSDIIFWTAPVLDFGRIA